MLRRVFQVRFCSLPQRSRRNVIYVNIVVKTYLKLIITKYYHKIMHSQKRHRLVASCKFHQLEQLVNKLQQNCQFHQAVTSHSLTAASCHLQACYNLLKQFAASLRITNFDNQLATSLLTTCNKSVDNLQQTCRQQAVTSRTCHT